MSQSSPRIVACRSQPISYLRLERHLQGDGSNAERRDVEQHLRECDACRKCFAELQRDVIVMPPLPTARASVARPQHSRRTWLPLTAAVMAAAAALLLIQKPSDLPSPGPRVAVKGGELALELVRERNGALEESPSHYSPADHFQARISCPPGAPAHWDVLVLQAGEVSYPLTPREPLACTNGITLPGAFSLDEAGPAQICVVLGARPLPRETTRSEQLPRDAACITLQPMQR